ncbi:hypothetical protein V6N13_025452 [Hibiscus sabdariffa]
MVEGTVAKPSRATMEPEQNPMTPSRGKQGGKKPTTNQAKDDIHPPNNKVPIKTHDRRKHNVEQNRRPLKQRWKGRGK